MENSIYHVTLDIKSMQSQVSLPMRKSFNARYICFSLVDGSKPYYISKECIAVFFGIKSDGTKVSDNCTISNNKIFYKVQEQAVSCPGIVDCELNLYGADEALLSTSRFTMVVDERAAEDIPISEDDIAIFDAIMLAEAERKTEEAQRVAVEKSRCDAESQRIKAETDRVLEENRRREGENARTEAEDERIVAETERKAAEDIRETDFAQMISEGETAITALSQATDDANNIVKDIQNKLDNGDFIGEKGDKGDQGEQGEKGDKGDKGDTPAIEQEYNPESENAQSGVAVSEAFKGILSTYESNNILNPDDYTQGYIGNTSNGTPSASSTMKYSTPIPVKKGDVIRSYRYDESTGTLTPYVMEFITAYQNGATLIYHGATRSHTYTVPSDIVDSIVISINPTVVHEITKNYEATEYEEYSPKRTEVKQEVLPVASETAFGVCKIWSTENESGEKVLNIITGESNE